MKIALGMIVYNEVKSVRKIVNELHNGVDEIIIVIDKPNKDILNEFNKIGEEYKCIIIESHGEECDRRNLYLEKTTCDWLITIDSDESISLDNLLKIKDFIVKGLPDNMGAIRLPIINYFGNGKWVTTFFPKIIRVNDNIRYNNSVQHTSVSNSIIQNNMIVGRFSQYIEHFGSLINKTEYYKREKRIYDMEGMLKKEQQSSFFYAMLAVEYISIGDIKNAFNYIQMSLRMPGDKDFGCYLEALIYYRLNLIWLAKEKLEKITKQTSFTAEAALLLADIDYREGKYTSSCERIRPYIEMHPDSVHLLVNYAAVMIKVDANKTIELLDQAIELLPSLKNSTIYKKGAEYNPYTFQDFFVSAYDNVFSIMSKAYNRLGKDIESKYWERYLEA